MVIKSGTDFHDLSEIWIEVGAAADGSEERVITKMDVKRHRFGPDDPHHPECQREIEEIMSRIGQATGKPVVTTLTPWDVRSEKVRTEESAIGDFIADILLHAYDEALRVQERQGELKPVRGENERQVDIAFLCGGALRGDTVYGPGLISIGDILEIMPFEDAVVVKEITGKQVMEALESSLSKYPRHEGRFPVFAGLAVKWDSRKPEGQRVLEAHLLADGHLFEAPVGDGADRKELKSRRYELVKHRNGYDCQVYRPAIQLKEPIDPEKKYRVVTREYMSDGYDGYEALKEGEFIVDHENGALMSALVRKFLLGASWLWRAKQLKTIAAEEGGKKEPTSPQETQRRPLSRRTKSAIDRAKAIRILSSGAHVPGDAPSTPVKQGVNGAPKTAADRLVDADELRRAVDQSPSGIRYALHIGENEHHSDADQITQMFRQRSSSSASGGTASLGNSMILSPMSEVGPKKDDVVHPPTRANSGTEGPEVKGTVSMSEEEAAELAKVEDGLAVVAPFTDGRLVDVARA